MGKANCWADNDWWKKVIKNKSETLVIVLLHLKEKIIGIRIGSDLGATQLLFGC